jgi:hypothetical protein
MSTLPIRASYLPQVRAINVRPFTGFARLVSFFSAVLDVFAEADELARVAYKRCPLVEE